MENKKIFVGSLPWSIKSENLKDMFASYGDIEDAVVITDRASGRSKGFGFVTFATAESAKKAVDEMNQKEVEGRKIFVNFARQQTERA